MPDNRKKLATYGLVAMLTPLAFLALALALALVTTVARASNSTLLASTEATALSGTAWGKDYHRSVDKGGLRLSVEYVGGAR